VNDYGKVWWVTLDDRGRMTIPPELLHRLGILPGAELALILGGHSVYIHPVRSDDGVS